MKYLADHNPIHTTFGEIVPPSPVAEIGSGKEGLAILLSKIVNIIYTVSAIVFIFMLLYAAFEWITSGGDKEKIESARNRITWAIIGIIILSLTFVFLRILGGITGFEFFSPNATTNQFQQSGGRFGR